MTRKKVIFFLLFFLCLAAAAFSMTQVIRILSQYRAGEVAYQKLTEQVFQPAEELLEPPGEPAGEPAEAPVEEAEPAIPWPEVDFETLTAQSPQVMCWLFGPGTGVNYPVVQGTDNSYYLNHLYDGTYNSAGSLFLDYRSDLSENGRWVIYGHYMRNGTMFADLLRYKEQDYYDAHPVFLLVLPEGRYLVEIFSGYVAGVEADAWRLDFAGDEDYSQWLADQKAASCFQSPVTPAPEDQVVTLSTCSYEFSNARFVLQGILRAEDEGIP